VIFYKFFTVWALEEVKLTRVEQKVLSNIWHGNQDRDLEEPVIKAALELQQSANKLLHPSEWSNIDSLLQFWGKIYIPQNLELRRQIVLLYHDSKIVGYPRHWKTLELVLQNYWWPQMSRYIGQYTSTCDLCLCTKPVQHSPVDELHALLVSKIQWNMLSVNFVVELPKSSSCNTVITVVDLVSKRAHFILIHTTVTVKKAARLFLHHVWKLHGLPQHVILDHRPQFVALFTKELYKLLGIRLESSMAWHLQMDGQMEHINQELDQYL